MKRLANSVHNDKDAKPSGDENYIVKIRIIVSIFACHTITHLYRAKHFYFVVLFFQVFHFFSFSILLYIRRGQPLTHGSLSDPLDTFNLSSANNGQYCYDCITATVFKINAQKNKGKLWAPFIINSMYLQNEQNKLFNNSDCRTSRFSWT